MPSCLLGVSLAFLHYPSCICDFPPFDFYPSHHFTTFLIHICMCGLLVSFLFHTHDTPSSHYHALPGEGGGGRQACVPCPPPTLHTHTHGAGLHTPPLRARMHTLQVEEEVDTCPPSPLFDLRFGKILEIYICIFSSSSLFINTIMSIYLPQILHTCTGRILTHLISMCMAAASLSRICDLVLHATLHTRTLHLFIGVFTAISLIGSMFITAVTRFDPFCRFGTGGVFLTHCTPHMTACHHAPPPTRARGTPLELLRTLRARAYYLYLPPGIPVCPPARGRLAALCLPSSSSVAVRVYNITFHFTVHIFHACARGEFLRFTPPIPIIVLPSLSFLILRATLPSGPSIFAFSRAHARCCFAALRFLVIVTSSIIVSSSAHALRAPHLSSFSHFFAPSVAICYRCVQYPLFARVRHLSAALRARATLRFPPFCRFLRVTPFPIMAYVPVAADVPPSHALLRARLSTAALPAPFDSAFPPRTHRFALRRCAHAPRPPFALGLLPRPPRVRCFSLLPTTTSLFAASCTQIRISLSVEFYHLLIFAVPCHVVCVSFSLCHRQHLQYLIRSRRRGLRHCARAHAPLLRASATLPLHLRIRTPPLTHARFRFGCRFTPRCARRASVFLHTHAFSTILRFTLRTPPPHCTARMLPAGNFLRAFRFLAAVGGQWSIYHPHQSLPAFLPCLFQLSHFSRTRPHPHLVLHFLGGCAHTHPFTPHCTFAPHCTSHHFRFPFTPPTACTHFLHTTHDCTHHASARTPVGGHTSALLLSCLPAHQEEEELDIPFSSVCLQPSSTLPSHAHTGGCLLPTLHACWVCVPLRARCL